MKLSFIKPLISLFSLSFMLIGCTQLPEKLRVDETVNLADYRPLTEQTFVQEGRKARWAGVIASVKNLSELTKIEVVYFDAKKTGRPNLTENTEGRFILYYPGFLDPMVYKKGKSITVLGETGKAEAGKIGEHPYIFPTLQASYVHLWKTIHEVDVRIDSNPFWHHPSYFYTGYPHRYPVYPVRSSAKVKSTSSSSTGHKSSPKSGLSK